MKKTKSTLKKEITIYPEEELTVMDNDFYTLWARFMLKPNAKKFKRDLENLAERGNMTAFFTWMELYPAGDNVIIDQIVSNFPNFDEEVEVDNFMFDRPLKKAETEFDKKTNIMCLAAAKQDYFEKRFTLKANHIKSHLLSIFCEGKDVIKSKNELDSLIYKGEGGVKKLVTLLSVMIKNYENIRSDYLGVLSQIAEREYSFESELQV